MNTVTIKINGIEYNLRGKENEAYLVNVAGYVDGKVKEIMNNNPRLSSTAVATLAALNIADELFKSDKEVDDYSKKYTSLEERHLTLRERLKEIKAETEGIIEDKDTEIEILKLTEEELSKKIEVMELQCDEAQALKYKIEELEKENQKIKELEEEIVKIEFQNNTLQKELIEKDSELVGALNSLDSINLKMKNIEDNSTEELEALITENKLLKSSNDDLRTAVEDSYIKLMNLEQENGQLTVREEELSNRLSSIEGESKSQIEFLEEKYKHKLQTLEVEFNEKLNMLQQEFNIQSKELEEKKDVLETLEKTISEKEALLLEGVPKEKEIEYISQIDNLKNQIDLLEEESKKVLNLNNKYKDRSKAMHLQLQTSRYKVLDLEKKLVDINIELAKERKGNNPLLKK